MVRWLLLMAAFLASSALSGCTDFDAEGDNMLVVRGVDLSAPTVSSGSLTLVANLTLDNLAASSGRIVLFAKAYDTATGLLVQTSTLHVAPIAKDKTRNAELRLELPRADGYRLDIEVRQDDRLVQVATVSASNLGRLEPNTHDTGLRVAALDFEVLTTAGNRTGVRATAYLTNEGAADSRPLTLQLKAREVETSLVVAQVWSPVAAIGREETQPFNATLSLPDAHNYDVEAILWDGQVIVERGTGHVQFAPRTTVAPGTGIVVSTPNLDAFAQDRQGASSGENSSPGPGLLGAVTVLALAAVLVRRSLR